MQDLGRVMMTWGKWSMYLSALLFLVIGVGALAIALVPGVAEWFAASILEAAGAPDDQFLVEAVTDEGAVGTTMLIIGISFLPCAALFWWCGRWFRQLQGDQRMAPTTWSGLGGGSPVPGGAWPASAAPAPSSRPSPAPEPPDPTAGGIIT